MMEASDILRDDAGTTIVIRCSISYLTPVSQELRG